MSVIVIAPEARFEVRPFTGVMCGKTLSGHYVRDLRDDAVRSALFDTETAAQEYRIVLVGAQRAIDATDAANLASSLRPGN